jgi:tetratricopeptide (TPR) repeat protein
MRNSVICVLILVVVMAVYGRVIGYPFVNYDDNNYVTENSHIRNGLTWSGATWAFSSTEHSNWHPLTWLSHALDCEIFGLQPYGHHLTNIVFHALNSVLLFLLMFQATKREGPSLVLALLFAVHPINVESVAWVAERKNVLSTFFFFLTLAAYGWYARKPNLSRYLSVLLFFACGLMSKPMLVTLPFVLLLLDYWPLERIGRNTSLAKLFVEKLPLFTLSGVVSVITFKAQEAGHAFHAATQFPFAVRFEDAIVAYALYLGKALWPSHLAAFYPHPGESVSLWTVAASSILLAVVTGLTLIFRSRPYLLMGWLWFLGTLVPVIGLVQVGDQGMADRYAYVPFIGVFLMFTWAAADFFQAQRTSQIVSTAMSLGMILALLFATNRQIGYWSSDTKLWEHTLAVTTRNAFAHRHVGMALLLSNNTDDALWHLREAVAISPGDPMNYVDLGLCLQESHQFDAAVEQYQKAMGVTANTEELAVAYTNLGSLYEQVGNYPVAIEKYKKAITLTVDKEQLATDYTNLGSAYDQSGNYQDAYKSYNLALQLNPKLFNAYFNRGLVLEREGKIEEAVADYQHSIELQPTARGYLELSRALQRLNRISEAQTSYEKARKLASDPKGIQ